MTIREDYFDGGHNMSEGTRAGTDETLAEIFRKTRSGRVTFAGAGDGVVAFDVAFADTDYTVVFGCQDSGAGLSTLRVKATTLATTGFTITASAACIAHWVAIHD